MKEKQEKKSNWTGQHWTIGTVFILSANSIDETTIREDQHTVMYISIYLCIWRETVYVSVSFEIIAQWLGKQKAALLSCTVSKFNERKTRRRRRFSLSLSWSWFRLVMKDFPKKSLCQCFTGWGGIHQRLRGIKQGIDLWIIVTGGRETGNWMWSNCVKSRRRRVRRCWRGFAQRRKPSLREKRWIDIIDGFVRWDNKRCRGMFMRAIRTMGEHFFSFRFRSIFIVWRR